MNDDRKPIRPVTDVKWRGMNTIDLLRRAQELAPAESQQAVADAIQDVAEEVRAVYVACSGPIDGSYQRVALRRFMDELYDLRGIDSRPPLSEAAARRAADDETAFTQELIRLRASYAASAAASLHHNGFKWMSM